MSKSGGENVWTLITGGKGLTNRKNMGMEWKGFRKVVKLTFEDGRTIRCTPDHKFYTTDGRQVEAKDLDFKNDDIVMGLDGVEDVNYGDEDGWSLQTSNFTFSCNDRTSREKAMAFARILGYILTDGAIHHSIQKDGYTCPIYFGHLIDAHICQEDIFLITGKSPKICENHSNFNNSMTYVIYLPSELSRSIGELEGVHNGKRVYQETTWPTFLFSSPKSIVREFLAGLFGGDGHAPYLRDSKGDGIVGVKFAQSVIEEHRDTMEKKINNLCDLLNQFEVDARIERIREYKNQEKNQTYLSFYVTIGNSLLFSQKIGIRYCTEKMQRLCLYKSYNEFQERVKKQSKHILELVDKHTESGLSVNKALLKAREDFIQKEAPLNEYYSLSSKTQVDNRRKGNRSTEVLHLSYKYFPTFSQFLEKMGCLEWYSKTDYIKDRDCQVVPTFHMKAIRIDEDGEDDVYCIGVEEFHNFICEGAIVLNCIPSRMTMSQLIEMLLGKTSALTGVLGDSTAFSSASINPTEAITKQLASLGFERHGNERLYSGYTGEMMTADIFIGTAYYQRLKHLVKDKMHCLTLDHEVLTLEGWKSIRSISTNDQVATLAKNGILQYQYPTHTWLYENYEGEMYHIKNQSIDLSVTGKHRMWVKDNEDDTFHFEEASSSFQQSRHYKKDAQWLKEDLSYISNISNISNMSKKQCREMIDILTDGKKNVMYHVYDKSRLDLIQRLCLHAGWCSDIDGTTINIYRDIFYPVAEKHHENVTIEKCDVMCITVPNEVFYVRRNGKAVWTGNSRSRGNVTMMHHQPSEGRSKDGGLRTGEMERDALIAHGGSAFIQETFFDMSDVYQVNVCDHCGGIISSPKECRACKKGDISRVNAPFCSKLLLQELQALGVSIKIKA